VGERLAIDPSRASRVVAAAVAAGYVQRVATAADGRRIGLVLTDAGRALAATTRASRAAWLGEAMAEWTVEDRHRFATLFTRFVDGLSQASPDGSG
jgi:DNA-binding MarR family transcriptional regulator